MVPERGSIVADDENEPQSRKTSKPVAPVQVRDSVNGKYAVADVPENEVNREWYAHQAEQAVGCSFFSFVQIEMGQYLNHGKTELKPQLLQLARSTPYYKRNEPHVCSFWLKGACSRGETCPYKYYFFTNIITKGTKLLITILI
jgi:hypothetical protein